VVRVRAHVGGRAWREGRSAVPRPEVVRNLHRRSQRSREQPSRVNTTVVAAPEPKVAPPPPSPAEPELSSAPPPAPPARPSGEGPGRAPKNAGGDVLEGLRSKAESCHARLLKKEGRMTEKAVHVGRVALRRFHAELGRDGGRDGRRRRLKRAMSGLGKVRDLDVARGCLERAALLAGLEDGEPASLADVEEEVALREARRCLRRRRKRAVARASAVLRAPPSYRAVGRPVGRGEFPWQRAAAAADEARAARGGGGHADAALLRLLCELALHPQWRLEWDDLVRAPGKKAAAGRRDGRQQALRLRLRRSEALHDLRRQVRDARYALEAALEGGGAPRELAPHAQWMRRVQDALGSMRDVEMLASVLGEEGLVGDMPSVASALRAHHRAHFAAFERERAAMLDPAGRAELFSAALGRP